MLNKKKVSVVIPCFNEAQALPLLLNSMPGFVDEVIVVDNASADDSAEIAKKYFATLIMEPMKGYGSALSTGIRYATGDVIALFDADNTYSVADVKKALYLIEDKDLDFVSGCRFPLSVAEQAMPLINQLSNRFISWLIRAQLQIGLKDSQSGFMVFRKHVRNTIRPENKGMGFSQEFKVKAWLSKGLRCEEMHIHYNARTGQSKFRKIPDGLGNVWAMIQLCVAIGKQ